MIIFNLTFDQSVSLSANVSNSRGQRNSPRRSKQCSVSCAKSTMTSVDYVSCVVPIKTEEPDATYRTMAHYSAGVPTTVCAAASTMRFTEQIDDLLSSPASQSIDRPMRVVSRLQSLMYIQNSPLRLVTRAVRPKKL